ncbi:MAG: hypothetical protein LBO06_08140 [Bacteroidales bacterium]|jgi:hypothetical protein|nr:hypothetical protein [Bacteroidales bacterium]
MFKKFVLVAAILAVAVVMPAKAQKLTKSNFRNLEIQAPLGNGWAKSTILNQDENGNEASFGIASADENGVKYVKVLCHYKATDVVAFITDMASEKSREPNFNYMSIEQVKDAKIGKQNAKLLTYSNSYLNEPFVGGIYGFVKDGYTYTVEYYGEDNPADVKLIGKIIQTIRVDVPEIDPTIVEKEEHFAPKEAKTQEEVAAQSQKEQEKIAKEQKKAEKEMQKAEKEQEKQIKKAEKERKDEIKKQEQAAKDAKKAQKEQEKELKKQKAAAKQAVKAKEEAVKQQEKAIKEQKKAIKEKEKIEKQQQKEAKKVMKEQKAALESQIDMIDQEEKAFKEEKKLVTEPTKEQKKIWKEKEKSLKDRKDAIKRQIKAL